MPRKKTAKIKTLTQLQIAQGALPLVMLSLVRKKIITKNLLGKPATLTSLFYKNLRKGVREMQLCMPIESDFLTESIQLWKRGKHSIAIVLYASAVEQYVNRMYQELLIGQGWPTRNVSYLLREVSTRSKLGWMFPQFFNRYLGSALVKRLATIFEIRNAIVHFKAELGRFGQQEDSYSKIEAKIRNLRRMSISRDFRLLEEYFSNALWHSDPNYRLVSQLCEKLKLAKHRRFF